MNKIKNFVAVGGVLFVVFLAVSTAAAKDCPNKRPQSKLICYYSKLTDVDSCQCSHVVLPANSDVKAIDRLKEHVKGAKFLISVNEFNQGLVALLKESKVDGLEINLKKLDNKNDISDFISTVRSKLGSDLYIALSVPAKAEILAKYYDFKALSKAADLFILETAFLGASKNVTFHPSRLSGLWDMQNTDSVVDLVGGLGAPMSKLVITAPVQAFQFKLQNNDYTAPGSPALEVKSITRDELCGRMSGGTNWTLERDQDQAGPYIFNKNQWIAFEDATSMDIKAKYSRVRGLAGLALKDLSQDGGTKCNAPILEAAYIGLSRQARAPRGAVLHSLEREILEPSARPLDSVQVSPYRISRVIDVEGHVHVIRQDTRTEFECSRQGYFVHPRSCNRFYRCVKFDQLSDEFNVFEFDCPAGLAFDERVEVCVWPGSLPHASACAGSSEIAPVPKERYICPGEPGYYADPENCRWFFACLDHGKSPLSAYEFRCPFGLVFDQDRLICEWSWLVPKCASGYAVGSQTVYGGAASSGVVLEQYNGLGALGTVALGGLSGHFEQPVAKVYSNAGGGLSYNAAQSLHNAGLLRSSGGFISGNAQGLGLHGLGGASQINLGGFNAQAGTGVGYQTLSTGYDTASVGASGTGGLSYQGNLAGANLGYQAISSGYDAATAGGLSYQSGLSENSGANLGYQAVSGSGASGVNLGYQAVSGSGATSGLAYQHISGAYGQGAQAVSGFYGKSTGLSGVDGLGYQAVSGSGASYGASGVNLGYQAGAAGASGLAYQDISGAYGQGAAIGYGYGTKLTGANLNNYGARSSQTFIQQNHGSSYVDTGAGTLGNVNIVGGGYSAVGLKSAGGVEITNNGDISSVTPSSTISLSTVSPIPVVTSVPLPSIKTATAFESYHGGVVANVPELQYKLTPSVGFANVTTGFIASSTPASVAVGYDYPRPAVSFVEAPLKPVVTVQKQVITATQPSISLNVERQGYVYEKPSVAFEEIPLKTVNQAAVSSYSFSTPSTVRPVVSVHKQDAGYVYNKPSVAFEEVKAINYGFSTVKPVTVVQENLNIIQKPLQTVVAQPAVSYQQQEIVQQNQGYVYTKPAVAFEETPVKTYTYSSPSTVKPVTLIQPTAQTVSVVSQPAISTYNIHQKQDTGYVYQKPSVTFEDVQQLPAAVTSFSFSTPKPSLAVVQQNIPVPVVQKPAPFSSYSYQKQDTFGGYEYKKPAVVFEETPVVSSTIKPVVVTPKIETLVQPNIVQTYQPAISAHNYQQEVKSGGYYYPKPSVVFEEKPKVAQVTPAVVSSYYYQQPQVQKSVVTSYQPTVTYQQPSVVTYQKPAVSSYTYQNVAQKSVGYSYPKPQIAFEEKPQVYVQQRQQPAVVSSYNYVAPSTVKPAVVLQKQEVYVQKQPAAYLPPAVVSSYNYVAPSTVKPAVVIQKQPQVYLPPVQPTVFVQKHQPAVVSSYNYVAPSTVRPAVVLQKQEVYVQKQPAAYLPPVQQPAVVSSYNYVAPSTVKPAVVIQKQPQVYLPPVQVQQPVVVSSYNYVAPSTVKPAVVIQKQPQVYLPPVQIQQPAVVSSYNYVAPSTVKPAVVVQKQQTAYLPPVQPAVVSSYNYVAPTVKPAVLVQKQQTAYLPPVQIQQQPAVVSNYNYNYVAPTTPKSAVFLQRQPEVYVQKQQAVLNYHYEAPSTVRPAVVSSYSYVAPTTAKVLLKQEFQGYDYPKPAVAFAAQPVLTSYDSRIQPVKQQVVVEKQQTVEFKGYDYPKPSVGFIEERQPVQEVEFVKKKAYTTGVHYKYEQPLVVENYQAPVVDNSNFYYVDKAVKTVSTTPVYYEEVVTPKVIKYVTPRPTYSSTIATVLAAKAQPTTSRPIVRYSFSSLDDQYNYNEPVVQYEPVRQRVRVRPTSIPVVSTEKVFVVPEVTREYLPVRNKVVTTEKYVEVTTPSREYLPIRNRVRVKTTTASPASEDIYVEEVEVTSRRPVKVIKVVRPKTVVKVNDYHPMLSAKLGAQCTCVSNKVKLRKPQKVVQKIIIEDDDDDDQDDDGYAVDVADDASPTIVESYEYEPQKTVAITPTPQVLIQSTTDGIVPIPVSTTPVYTVRKRVRVRPVSEAVEVFVKKTKLVTPAEPSDRQIVDAVRTGLKLVKQAAKEGAAEAINNKGFDRYGPGGWRSRDETLQGTIDCQRAGLFRHPTQCNKFYACRWDCTKKRFTLHVFNCPVHLTFDNNLGACNWPSQGPACMENTLLPND